MTPPINIGGDTVEAITIDGTSVGEVTVGGDVVFSTTPDSGISQEEDGDISEWQGDTSFYNVVNSPTVSGSSFAIEFTNDLTERVAHVTFDQNQHNLFQFSFQTASNINNSVTFYEETGADNVPLFGVFGKDQVDYAGSKNQSGFFSTAVGRGGPDLASGNGTYFEIRFENIDYQNNILDVVVDGTTVLTDEPFFNGGVPNAVALTSNSSNNQSGGFVDKIDFGN